MNSPMEGASSSTSGIHVIEEAISGSSTFSSGPGTPKKSAVSFMDNPNISPSGIISSALSSPSLLGKAAGGLSFGNLTSRIGNSGSSSNSNSSGNLCHFLDIPQSASSSSSTNKTLSAADNAAADSLTICSSTPSTSSMLSQNSLRLFHAQSSSLDEEAVVGGSLGMCDLPSPTISSTMIQQHAHRSTSSTSSSAINQTSDYNFSQGSINKDSSSIDDDSKSQPDAPDSSKRPFVPCKVCGDKASGYHYGVTSCEGCKGFFRRSIQKQIEYRCLRDGKCMIIRLNRNRCQYCRFKKCLAVGMSRDSVRYGRVPKRSKSTDDHSVSSTDSSQDQSAIESKQLAIYDIILNISQAHHAHCAITEDKIKNIPRNPASLRSKIRIPQGQVLFSNEELEMQRLLMWQQLAYIITPSIHSVVEFSKRVPSFSELSQDDQLILIKTGFFEIWLIRMCRMIIKQENMVVFENGSCIPREELAVVYTPDFVTSLFEMVSSFNMLNLNDTEIGLFTGIVLTTADRQGLSDSVSVERIQDQLVEALQLQINRSHSTEENLFASIILKAPELRTLGSQHNDLLRWYRTQWHRISLPPLFAEIYDIPKNQTDAQTS